MDLGLTDKLAVVTGASKNIGRGIALQLAKEGARVVIVARSQPSLDEAIKEMPGSGHHAIALDLMAPGAPTAFAERVLDEIGAPDIVVHNLGGSNGVFKTFAPAEDWAKVWQYNVGIGHDLNRAFIPPMVERKWGRVIHLSTLSATTFAGYSPYVSAKTALTGYIKAVTREVSQHNVIISAVAPGAIYLEGRYFSKLEKEDPAGKEEYFKHYLPMRRFGRVEDIAPVVAFLASEYAGFMAGSIVSVDGGGR